jgi:hypothetical protein
MSFFILLLLFLDISFVLSMSFRSKRSLSLSSPRAQLSITPFLAWDGDDIFYAAMPTPKPLARHGGFSWKKKSVK